MASLKVYGKAYYGKAYSANVTRVLATLAEKNVDDYQIVPIDLLTGANKTPEYLKLQVLAASPASLFHLSSPLKNTFKFTTLLGEWCFGFVVPELRSSSSGRTIMNSAGN
jgi:hypothetical protein